MARTELDRAVLPSLLDRLTDYAPREAVDPSTTRDDDVHSQPCLCRGRGAEQPIAGVSETGNDERPIVETGVEGGRDDPHGGA